MQDSITPSEKPKFSEESINRELEAILSWPQLKSSDTLARFLKFVVKETISGRAFEIKEYTIGLHVFKRPTSFNPQKDAIVRISAGRLRRLLSRYYDSRQKENQLRISIPKGTYVPVFETLADEQSRGRRNPVAGKIAIAVVPFWNMSAHAAIDHFVDGLGEILTRALAISHEYDVIAYRSLHPHFSHSNGNLFEKIDAQYFITGNLRFNHNTLELSIQVIFSSDLRLIWTSTFNKPLTDNIHELQDELVTEIMKSLGNLNGVLLEHLCQLPQALRTEIINNRNAAFWLYYYKKLYTKEALTLSYKTISASLIDNPLDSTAHAVLSQLFADSYLFGLSWTMTPLQDALLHAEKSIQLDSKSQYGHVSLAYVHLLMHDRDKSLSALRQSISINEGVTSILGIVGVIQLFNGEYQNGFDKIKATLQTNPYCRWLYEIASSLYYFSTNDYEKAYYEACQPGSNVNRMAQILRVSSLGKREHESAIIELGFLKNGNPDILAQVRPQLDMILMDKTLIDEIIDGITLAINMGTKKKTDK